MADETKGPAEYVYGDPRTVERLMLRDGARCFYCGHPFSATMEGYFHEEMRCKYVEPFLTAARGVAIIAREVEAVEAMWALEQRLGAMRKEEPA